MEQRRPTHHKRETETIARVPHLLSHIAAQLPALAQGGATFEEVRVRYGATQNELGKLGLARVTTPRAGIRLADRYWSSVRDLIKELQTLGWLEPGVSVPSRGGTVDKHRESRHRLTDEGERIAALVGNRRELADELTTASLAHHPYLRALLEALDEAPIFCPEATHGQVAKNSSRRFWAERGTALLARSDPRATLTAYDLESGLAQAHKRRFGRRRAEGEQPTPKDVAKALSASFADAALEARGLRFGATTLESLCDLGMELRLLDQSRYVPGHDDGNLVWLCCDLERDGDRLRAHRRGFSAHGERVAQALTETYFGLRANPSADTEGDRRTGTYQMIHVVRAAAAFQTGTARELANRALEALAAGQIDLGVGVRLQAARFEQPPRSEPMYARGGTRALTLTMTRANGVRATAGDQQLQEEEMQ